VLSCSRSARWLQYFRCSRHTTSGAEFQRWPHSVPSLRASHVYRQLGTTTPRPPPGFRTSCRSAGGAIGAQQLGVSCRSGRAARANARAASWHPFGTSPLAQSLLLPELLSLTACIATPPATHQVMQHGLHWVVQVLHVVQADNVVQRVGLEGQLVGPCQQRVARSALVFWHLTCTRACEQVSRGS